MILRGYQTKAVSDTLSWLDSYRNPGIVVAPTGSGKSLIISDLSHKLSEPVLIFQPTVELLRQNFEKYQLYDDNATIFSASAKKKVVGDVTFATIGSVINQPPELFNRYKYLLVDECHLYPSDKKQFTSFLAQHPDIKVIGLTATPFRLKSSGGNSVLSMLHGTSHIWGGYSSMVQIDEVSEYWSKIHYYSDEGDTSILKVNTSGSEYTDVSLKKYTTSIEDNIISAIEEFPGKSMVVFVPSIANAEKLANIVGGSAVVSSLTPGPEREGIIKDFKAGRIRVVFNVNILGVGFDFPQLDGIIDAQPTLSLARYYQRVGRICRYHDSKEMSYYVCMSGNYKKFGRIEDLRFVRNKKGPGYHCYSGENRLTGVRLSDPGDEIPSVMTFGKYLGTPIVDLPTGYLRWLKSIDITRGLEIAVNRALEY